MREFIFRPMFGLADMMVTTTAAALMLAGHWLAAVPILLLAVPIGLYGKRYMAGRPAPRFRIKGGR